MQSILERPDSLWQMKALASYDYYTYTHCVGVCMFLVAASKKLLNITDARTLEQIGLGGILHDVGKSEISDKMLQMPGKLTTREFEVIKQHPAVGVDIARGMRDLHSTTAGIIWSHHERLDGRGYPDALAPEQIGPIVKLAGIVDVSGALTTNRPYARARTPFKALHPMVTEMREGLDVDLVRAFAKFLGPKDEEQEGETEGGSETPDHEKQAAVVEDGA